VKNSAVVLAVLAGLSASAIAHAQSVTTTESHQAPTYRVSVVSRTTRAVKYEHRGKSTKVNFRGTDLMPAASGEARVEGQRGAIAINAQFNGLDRPNSFGNEYLTYVLWAISPEGRSINVGEVLVGNDHRSKLSVTTDLQAFALIVTAEPYYAVRRPSNVVVLENEVRLDTIGASEEVDAKYELIDRGGYIPTGYQFDPVVLNANLPLEFYEARNAVRIAKSAGAEQSATSSYESAVSQMKRADDMATMRHADRKSLISLSREVVQTADDAREISMKRIEADRLSAEREASSGRVANADARSREATMGRMNAESATADANRRREQSDRATKTAQQLQLDAQVESGRNLAAAADANRVAVDAQRGQRDAEAESERNKANAADANKLTVDAQRSQRDAEAESERNKANAADANKLTVDAQRSQRAAEAESERNKAAAANSNEQLQQSVRDREELRAKLLLQFNAILSTRDTARGLVVNMSDVLFDTGKYTLRPMAREKLAKISGIVLVYPELRLAIEGNTDSVGSDDMNQTLSEKRASAVLDYLATQNVPAASMTSRGYGKTQPTATNDTPEGRQHNRRVELVVSGEVIGTSVGSVTQNPPLSIRQ